MYRILLLLSICVTTVSPACLLLKTFPSANERPGLRISGRDTKAPYAIRSLGSLKPVALNNRGQVLVVSEEHTTISVPAPPSGDLEDTYIYHNRTLLWQEGRQIDIGHFDKYESTEGTCLNDAGQGSEIRP